MCSENERAKWGEREPRFVVTEKKERKKERKKRKEKERKEIQVEREVHSWRFHLEQLDEREKKKKRMGCGGRDAGES